MSFDASVNLFPGVTSFLKNGSENVPIAHLSSAEVIGIYFSAHWCGPCRGFTPVLSKAYDELKAAGKRFEIVFVSCDRDEASMRSYHADMPWLCLQWEDLKRIEDNLNETYECQGIPHLVLLDAETGKVITTEGRSAIALGPLAFPFTPAAVSAAKQSKNRKVLDLFDGGRALGLKLDALPSDAVAVFICNSENSARHVIEPLCQATKALGSRIKVVAMPFQVSDADKHLIFAAKFHPDWHVLENSDALASAIFDAVGEDPEEALLLVCNSTFTEVIQTDAMRAVYRHKEQGFPWSDEALAQAAEEQKRKVASFQATLHEPGLQFLNGAQIVSRPGGASHSLDELRAMDCVGLYFSAHWCPPCRQFTPQLARVYQQLADEGKSFGVVFVSSDKSAQQFQEYFDTMPWVALSFDQRDLKGLLSEAFEVEGIPTLVFIDPKTGKCNANGTQLISEFGASTFPWGDEQLSAAAAAAAAKDAELDRHWRDAGKVVLKQHRGNGKRSIDHTVEFKSFNTFVADVKLSDGRFYFEVEVLSLESVIQFGVSSEGFEARADPGGEGVGDDSFSFAVDGVRQCKWPGGAYGSEWTDGQVIGFAIDMSKAGSASMSVSVDGSFAAPDGVAFDDISASWLSPAFSGSAGKFRINFGDTPFKHSPPDASFVSVHEAALARA